MAMPLQFHLASLQQDDKDMETQREPSEYLVKSSSSEKTREICFTNFALCPQLNPCNTTDEIADVVSHASLGQLQQQLPSPFTSSFHAKGRKQCNISGTTITALPSSYESIPAPSLSSQAKISSHIQELDQMLDHISLRRRRPMLSLPNRYEDSASLPIQPEISTTIVSPLCTSRTRPLSPDSFSSPLGRFLAELKKEKSIEAFSMTSNLTGCISSSSMNRSEPNELQIELIADSAHCSHHGQKKMRIVGRRPKVCRWDSVSSFAGCSRSSSIDNSTTFDSKTALCLDSIPRLPGQKRHLDISDLKEQQFDTNETDIVMSNNSVDRTQLSADNGMNHNVPTSSTLSFSRIQMTPRSKMCKIVCGKKYKFQPEKMCDLPPKLPQRM